MAGQLWSSNASGGYMYADNLSKHLRMQLQSMTKFRMLADPREDAIGLNNGDVFRWNRYSNISGRGRPLGETQRMPETSFTVGQSSLTITEYGNSVPFTGKLELLAEHDVKDIIDQTLRDDARKTFDRMTAYQFFQSPLRVTPTSGTSTTALDFFTTGQTTTTNNVALRAAHVRVVAETMQERNIPAFEGEDYACISHPSTYRTFKSDMESLNQYTESGIARIFLGEIGRYDGVRFIVQTEIPKGHAYDAKFDTTEGSANDIYTATDDAWNNGLSSWAVFFGADTVVEAPAVPEEIRAKLPGDYGRDKGIAWYYLGGAGLTHSDATNARVVIWDSAA